MNLFNIKKLIDFALIIIMIMSVKLYASERDLIDLAERNNRHGDYYSAVSELLRYQYLYPAGEFYPVSLNIMGEAFRRGGNYDKSVKSFNECREKFRNTPEGEKALYSLGYVHLTMGYPFFAYKSFQEYRYIYKEGSFGEDVSRDLCYTLLLMHDINGAYDALKKYENDYSDGKYLTEIRDLKIRLDEEMSRPKKSVWVSVIGSVFIPGFGHFYTGKYELGVFTFVTNTLLGYLFYDGYKDRSKLRMGVFGLAELSFYQYSLYSAISDVHEYNNNGKFYKAVHLGASKDF